MITIDKPGKTKAELLASLEKLQTDYAKEIAEYEIQITPITDGFNLKGSKQIVFITFSADVNIKAEDGKYVIDYTANNIPQAKLDEAIGEVTKVLEKC
ncbi:MAG: hypothetical protein KDD00_17575 [Ignavibacteriae bacterium]|nr:hypothetical protein [Ignavibacteriota bacterium]